MIRPLLEPILAEDFGLTPHQLDLIAAHWDLLLRWNHKVNLTSITDDERAAWLHYRDSLMGLRHLTCGPVVDFGSGGGFPGLVLAIARPDWHFTLVEPRNKRASFLQRAEAALGLTNVRVLCARLEDEPDAAYAHGVTRATFSDVSTLSQAARWLKPGGSVVAYRAADAPVAPHAAAIHGYPYAVGGRARRIDVWTFP